MNSKEKQNIRTQQYSVLGVYILGKKHGIHILVIPTISQPREYCSAYMYLTRRIIDGALLLIIRRRIAFDTHDQLGLDARTGVVVSSGGVPITDSKESDSGHEDDDVVHLFHLSA